MNNRVYIKQEGGVVASNLDYKKADNFSKVNLKGATDVVLEQTGDTYKISMVYGNHIKRGRFCDIY